jgi:hypothetical protein
VKAASNELMVTLGTAAADGGALVAVDPEQPATMTATAMIDVANFLVSKTDSSF